MLCGLGLGASGVTALLLSRGRCQVLATPGAPVPCAPRRRAVAPTPDYAGAVPPEQTAAHANPQPSRQPSQPSSQPPSPRPGPVELVLVRHGESVGNVADRDARRRGAGRLTP